MGVNKVNLANGETLIDISDSTISAETIVSGNKGYKADGTPVNGTNPYELNATNTTVNTQADLIAQIQSALEGKAAGGSGEYTIYPAKEAPSGAQEGDIWLDYSDEIAAGGIPDTITAGDTPVAMASAAETTTSTTVAQIGPGLTVARAGTYRIKADAFRSNTSGTWSLQAYKNGTAISGATATFSSYIGTLSADVSCAEGDVITVHGRSRGTSYTLGVLRFALCINWDNGYSEVS